jgi:hypothetical protein
MKLKLALLFIAFCAMAFPSCSRADFTAALPGRWQWTGDECDSDGSCKKEIMTDEGSCDTFTRDGFYVSRRSRNGYSLQGGTIRFDSTQNLCGMAEAEIVSLAGDELMLRCGSVIRRYARVRPH